jgi:RNA polymerase sigma factor for flagellar operon FliA
MLADPATTKSPGGNRPDRTQRDTLITENLDLVAETVRQVAGRYPPSVERDELWSAGALGLIEAAGRYDQATGVPFPQFARLRIRGAVIDCARARDWAARSVRRDDRAKRRAETAFAQVHGRGPTRKELAAVMQTSVDALVALEERTDRARLLHIEWAPDGEPLAARIPEPDPAALPEEAFEEDELLQTLRDAVAELPPTQRVVLERHFFAEEYLRDIAKDLGVTEVRVSQICAEAVASLRVFLGTLYEGVPEVPDRLPGKRARAAYLAAISLKRMRDRRGADEALLAS